MKVASAPPASASTLERLRPFVGAGALQGASSAATLDDALGPGVVGPDSIAESSSAAALSVAAELVSSTGGRVVGTRGLAFFRSRLASRSEALVAPARRPPLRLEPPREATIVR